MFPAEIDQLIHARWVIPVEPAGVLLENHSVALSAGKIVDLLPQASAVERYVAKREFRLDKHILLPGLVNAHCHAAMNLFRGLADDLPLYAWLENHIWPAEARHVSPEFVYDGTLLACAEMLRGGITCFNDMYFFPEAAARAVSDAGMRAVLGLPVLEFASAYAADAEDYLAKGLACRDAWRDAPRLSFALAPHAPYTVSDRSFERIAVLNGQLDLPLHIHVHETRGEVEESVAQHGLRPLQRLQRLGMVSPNLIAVHAVHLDASDIALLADGGASVAHCPTSNLKLACGIAPLGDILAAGINVGIGTDSAASNNRLDILAESRLAALLAKGTSGDASLVNAAQALHMATLGGARALGLADRIGSIVPGKQADLCALSLEDHLLAPCYQPAAHLVNTLARDAVSHVWVEGQVMLESHNLCGFLKNGLENTASLWQTRICPSTLSAQP